MSLKTEFCIFAYNGRFQDALYQFFKIRGAKKGNPNLGISGGIVDKNMPIHISNIAIFNPKTKKADRVGFRVDSDGKKVRFFKSNKETIGD